MPTCLFQLRVKSGWSPPGSSGCRPHSGRDSPRSQARHALHTRRLGHAGAGPALAVGGNPTNVWESAHSADSDPSWNQLGVFFHQCYKEMTLNETMLFKDLCIDELPWEFRSARSGPGLIRCMLWKLESSSYLISKRRWSGGRNSKVTLNSKIPWPPFSTNSPSAVSFGWTAGPSLWQLCLASRLHRTGHMGSVGGVFPNSPVWKWQGIMLIFLVVPLKGFFSLFYTLFLNLLPIRQAILKLRISWLLSMTLRQTWALFWFQSFLLLSWVTFTPPQPCLVH